MIISFSIEVCALESFVFFSYCAFTTYSLECSSIMVIQHNLFYGLSSICFMSLYDTQIPGPVREQVSIQSFA